MTTRVFNLSASGAAFRWDLNSVPRLTLTASLMNVGSGFQLNNGSGLYNFGPVSLPTGFIALGATGLPSVGLLRVGAAAGQSQNIVTARNDAGTNLALLQWGSDGLNVATTGSNSALAKWWYRANVEHRWLLNGADKASLDAGQFSLKSGTDLGVGQLAHSATDSKLGAWTPSGFASVATGIRVGASGMSVQAGASGAIMSASGMSIGEARYTSSDVYLANGGAGTPSLVPSGGGRLFISPMTSATGGALMYYGPSGTLTLIGRP